jgi:DNA-binding NtrC family response regulator
MVEGDWKSSKTSFGDESGSEGATILVAAKDPTCWRRVQSAVRSEFAVAFAVDSTGLLQAIRKRAPAVIVVWSGVLDGSLRETVHKIAEHARTIPVVVVTTQGAEADAVSTLPVTAHLREEIVDGALLPLVRAIVGRDDAGTRSDLDAQVIRAFGPKRRPPDRGELSGATLPLSQLPSYRPLVIGSSPAFRRVMEMIQRVAPVDVTVLVSGESGCGKELIARWIHCLSPRAQKPFECVDLPAVPDELFESILFGHERGAFTGAVAPNQGKFQRAQSGTLFLDEVSNLKPQLQPKLLRAIQERQVQSLGGRDPVMCETRIIAATNVNLADAVGRGEFREDLYFRLSVVVINLPPLRDRITDIPALLQFFIDKYSEKFGCESLAFSDEALDALTTHKWPGNIRELENRVQSAVLLRESDRLEKSDFFRSSAYDARPQPLEFRECEYSLEELQRLYIEQVLQKTNGNQSQAAQILEIDRKTLRLKLRKSSQARM